MPVTKLTVKAVDKLVAPDPSGKQVARWDAELKGFGVLCSRVPNSKIRRAAGRPHPARRRRRSERDPARQDAVARRRRAGRSAPGRRR